MIEVVQNTVEPLGNAFCEKMRRYFKWENKITLSFSHLPVFSDNESTRIATQQAIITMYQGLLDKSQITIEEFNQILFEYGIKEK